MLKHWLSEKYIIAVTITLALLTMLPVQYFLSSPSMGSFYSMLTADRGVTVERGVSYGPNARHKLDIYRPTNGEKGPIAIFFYGGRWREGDRGIYGFLGAALAARGVTTIIPDYRLYPEVTFPAFIHDAAKAYGWAHNHLAATAANGTSKARPIIVMGHSAGAHIAALLSFDSQYLASANAKTPMPAGLISLAGPLAFDPTTDPTTKDVFANVTNADTARPISFAAQGRTPTLLVHGLEDETVGPWNSRNFAKALKKAGVSVCKQELPGIGHVGLILALSKPLRWRGPVLEASVKFIKDVGNGKVNGTEFGC